MDGDDIGPAAPLIDANCDRFLGEVISPLQVRGNPPTEMKYERTPGGYYCSKEGTKVLYGLKILNAPEPLAELIEEVNYATPKQVFFFDSSFAIGSTPLPANWTDNRSCATTIPIHLDPLRAVPEIVAHELMHSWIEFYLGLEDCRQYVDQSNRATSMVVNFVQSMVLDCTVLWQLRKRKGFNLDIFRRDIMASARENVTPLKLGMMHATPMGQLVAAYSLAVPRAFPDLYELTAAARKEFDGLWRALCKCEPSIARTADKIATALREHGYESESGIRASVDKSLLASFEFLCFPLDLAADMVPRTVYMALADKLPEFMPGWPITIKHAALRDSIRARQHVVSAAYTPGKHVLVNFAPQGSPFFPSMLPKIARPSGEGPTHMLCYDPGMTKQEEDDLLPPLSDLPFPYPDIYSQSYTSLLGQVGQTDHLIGKEQPMFYMPDIGRFAALDMIRRPGRNPYLYTEDNPLQSVDPMGTQDLQIKEIQRSADPRAPLAINIAADISKGSQAPEDLMMTNAGPVTGFDQMGGASSGFVTIPGLNPMAFNPHAFSGPAGAAAWAALGGLLGLAGVDLGLPTSGCSYYQQNGCCCCAESMEFVHDTSTKGKPSVWAPGVETYVEPDTWRGGKRFGLQGHNFAAHTTFSYYKSTIRSDCKFFWFEKTNVPYVKGMNANEWTDMFTHPATQEWDPQHPQNKHWDWNRNSRQSLLDSCPKKYEVYEDDPPGYWKYPEDHNAPAWRRLEFRIVIYSGEGCTRCKKRVVFLTASQYIDSKTVTWTDPNTRDAAFNP